MRVIMRLVLVQRIGKVLVRMGVFVLQRVLRMRMILRDLRPAAT